MTKRKNINDMLKMIKKSRTTEFFRDAIDTPEMDGMKKILDKRIQKMGG